MKDRFKRRDLFHQPVSQFLSGTDRQRGNVIDRLFRIQLGALPPRLVENIDKVTAQVQKPQFEHRKQAARACTDDDDVGLLDISHDSIAVRSRGGSGAGAADRSGILCIRQGETMKRRHTHSGVCAAGQGVRASRRGLRVLPERAASVVVTAPASAATAFHSSYQSQHG